MADAVIEAKQGAEEAVAEEAARNRRSSRVSNRYKASISLIIRRKIKWLVTAAMVKELREMTGAGMMDCKKALTATDGDMDKAVEFLREKGLATAQKKAGRIAAEGIVMLTVSEDGKKAVVVEVNAETDFVAKNEKFQGYVAQVAEQALNTKAADIDAFHGRGVDIQIESTDCKRRTGIIRSLSSART